MAEYNVPWGGVAAGVCHTDLSVNHSSLVMGCVTSGKWLKPLSSIFPYL